MENVVKTSLIILFFTIFMAFPFSYLFSRPINNMFQLLSDASDMLDEKVRQEVEKSHQKDRLLQNQSKLAALGEIITMIAHQWRHPITRVSLILQNLKELEKRGKLDKENLSISIQKSIEQIDFMSSTIDDFKNFYKPQKEKKYFYARFAIGKAVRILNASLKSKNISINISIKDDEKIFGYSNYLAQVVLNVINNAKDAMEEKNIQNPCINISMKADHKNLTISIEDNAGGISEENMRKIFDPYFTTKDTDGTGLGLYISRLILEDKFGGVIVATNIKNGARFDIKLPYESSLI